MLLVAYDGTSFHGFAAQPGQHTVGGTLAEKLSSMAGHEVSLTCAGRTDSGVQISSHFDEAIGTSPTGTLTLSVAVGCGQLTVETGGADAQTRAGGGGPARVTASAARRPVAGGR